MAIYDVGAEQTQVIYVPPESQPGNKQIKAAILADELVGIITQYVEIEPPIDERSAHVIARMAGIRVGNVSTENEVDSFILDPNVVHSLGNRIIDGLEKAFDELGYKLKPMIGDSYEASREEYAKLMNARWMDRT